MLPENSIPQSSVPTYADLSAGCYGQMNGYKTRIFEMGTKPGGCIHWLVGSSPGNSFYHCWEEVGAVQGRTMINYEEYARIEGKEGKAFIVYSDVDRLEQHMKVAYPFLGVALLQISLINFFHSNIGQIVDVMLISGVLSLVLIPLFFLKVKKWPYRGGINPK